MTMYRRIRRWLLPSLLIVLLSILGAQMYVRPHQRALLSLEYWKSVQRLSEVMRVIGAYYVNADQVDYAALGDEAIAAMLRSLDEHSLYLGKEQLKYLEQQSDQHYVGIGVEVVETDNRVIVTGVFPGSGAEEAGVGVGDEIVAIEGEDVRQAALFEIVARLSGESGTVVHITFSDEGGDQRELEVMRRRVQLPIVARTQLLENGVGYIRITHFGQHSAEGFDEALAALSQESELRGLVLDLRGNPGGVVTGAVDVLDRFFAKGTLLLSAKGRGRWKEGVHWYSDEEPTVPLDLPVVVLVDRDSASAAEIVAGVLQEYDRGVVVGETTVGKGSIQSVYRFGDDEGFKLTTAMYYLPNSQAIYTGGIVPDVEVTLAADGDCELDDPFMQAALKSIGAIGKKQEG